MPFIIVFNIIVSIVAGGVLLTILGCSLALRDARKKTDEKSIKMQEKIEKVKGVTYLVFFGVLILMILVNLIF